MVEPGSDNSALARARELGLTLGRGVGIPIEDHPALLDLVRAALPPGQPEITAASLKLALSGRSTVDGAFWTELESIEHLVVRDDHRGVIVSAACIATRPDGGRTIPWLFAGENDELTRLTLDLALEACQGNDVDAFSFATAFGLGLEGLPVATRPSMHQALLDRGFTEEDAWIYMMADLAHVARDEDVALIEPSDETTPRPEVRSVGWKLTGPGETSAEVEVGSDGLGVVWWIEVDEAHRGKGLGRKLLRQALALMADHGAARAILYVDHDDPSERNRQQAINLYQSEHFKVIDHLWSYTRTGSAPSS